MSSGSSSNNNNNAFDPFSVDLTNPKELAQLNRFLGERTFVNDGVSADEADAKLLAALHATVSAWNDETKWANGNVSRWFDHAQRQCNVDLAEVKFRQTQPVAKKGGGKGKGKGKGNGNGNGGDAGGKGKGKGKGGGKKGNGRGAPPPAEDKRTPFGRVMFRIGKVVDAKPHPNAETLLLETIDFGEEEPRQVVSGIARWVKPDELKGRLVVCVTNLKPSKLRGIVSSAMVLCVKNDEDLVTLAAPEGASIGARVTVEGECDPAAGEPDAQLPPKKKIWEQVAPHLKTDANGVATYLGKPLVVGGDGGASCFASMKDCVIG